MVQCEQPVGWVRAKNTAREFSFSKPLPPRGGYSLRGHTKVPLRTLYLLVVGEIGLRLINCDDGVLLALV